MYPPGCTAPDYLLRFRIRAGRAAPLDAAALEHRRTLCCQVVARQMQVGIGHMFRPNTRRTEQPREDRPTARRGTRHPDGLAAQPTLHLPPRGGHAHGPLEEPLITGQPHESQELGHGSPRGMDALSCSANQARAGSWCAKDVVNAYARMFASTSLIGTPRPRPPPTPRRHHRHSAGAPPQIDRLGSVRDGRAGLMHPDEPAPQRLVHQFLERLLERVPQVLDSGGHIVVKRKGGSHTSRQNHCDVAMPTPRGEAERQRAGVPKNRPGFWNTQSPWRREDDVFKPSRASWHKRGAHGRGCPCPESRRRRPAEPWMAERRRLRVTAGPEGRRERPATGRGHRRPTRTATSHASENCKSRSAARRSETADPGGRPRGGRRRGRPSRIRLISGHPSLADRLRKRR